MSDELKKVYEAEDAIDRYYDEKIPRDLFRGRKKGLSVDIMQPMILGFYRRTEPRLPDVHLHNEAGKSPQFKDETESMLVIDDKHGTLTADIVGQADKYMVRGCRTLSGNYRGVSVFDRKNTGLRNFDWFKIPKDTELPPSLACTRDRNVPEEQVSHSKIAVHYTIAPKDDMTLSLFLQALKSLSNRAVKEDQ